MTTTEDREDAGQERMAERVATLLRHAEDFRRHGEDGSADAALALAEQIMLKFSIDAATIAARQAVGDREAIVTEWLPFTGIYRVALAPWFDQLVRAYSTVIRSFISRGDKVNHVVVIGPKTDVKQIKLLVTSLHLQAIAGMNIWWRDLPERFDLTGMAGYKARRQYIIGFIQGAKSRIERARQSALADAEPGTALVLSDRRREVDLYVEQNFTGLRADRSRMKPGAALAAEAGYRDGQRANTGDTPVGGNRRQLEA